MWLCMMGTHTDDVLLPEKVFRFSIFSFFLGRRSVVSRRPHRPNMTTEQLACGRTAF